MGATARSHFERGMPNMSTKERYEQVFQEFAQVCADCGRSTDDVRLIAVSKTVGKDDVALALDGGATDFGENRPEGLMEKGDAFPQARWHFIGNIQSRRIRDIVGRACLIHSLYQIKHAEKIDEVAAAAGIVQDVLVEVNVSGEESKSGVSPDELPAFLDALAGLAHVRVCGLMTMAPAGDLEVARNVFADLRRLRDTVKADMGADRASCFNELSMGMSQDWREAVLEGATMVRIGRAIFSDTFSAQCAQ